jgi:hypothetical protein
LLEHNDVMETIVIELTNQKAYKILKELENLHLIRVIKETTKLSSLRKKIQAPMNEEDINAQLNTIRKEWQRDI